MAGRCAVLVLAAVQAAAAGPVAAAHHGRGWDGGFERLHYRVSWGLLTAGEAIIQARSPGPGRAEFLTETCAFAPVEVLYQGRDRLLAHSRPNGRAWRTRAFRTTREEGGERRVRQYRFGGNGVVHVRDLVKGTTDYLPVPPGTMDLLTALFVVRSRHLEPGDDFTLPVLDQGEFLRLRVAVQPRERLPDGLIGDGAMRATSVRLHLEEAVTGERRGLLRIWFGTGRRQLPLRLEAGTRLGSITLELRGVQTKAPPDPQSGLACQ
jgi:hypothetical protein